MKYVILIIMALLVSGTVVAVALCRGAGAFAQSIPNGLSSLSSVRVPEVA